MMRSPLWLILVLGIVLSAACGGLPSPAPAASLPSPAGEATLVGNDPAEVSRVKTRAQAYLEAWKAEQYETMYGLLTTLSQDALSEEEFRRHYESIAEEAALGGLSYEILSVLVDRSQAQVRYRVTLQSRLVGEVTRETVMNLRREKEEWRIEWDDTLVLPELKGGNFLLMDRSGYIPARANIYDRDGRPLVAQAEAVAVGFLPDRIPEDQVESVLALLAEVCGTPLETLRARYQSAPRGADWYVPAGEVSAERLAAYYEVLSAMPAVRLSPTRVRYYFEGGIAPHVVGYVGAIQPEELDEYLKQGYQPDDRVGRSGLEKWGERYLAGKRGGALYVYSAQGRPLTRLARVEAQPAQDIYSTLERDFQMGVQQALSAFRGAIVVLERDSGRVLAMASAPSFDPNIFEPTYAGGAQRLFAVVSDPSQPLLNRATQGQYPLGSVFKIITMAAALESGRYSAESTYQCGYFFDELPGVRLHDWTYDYYLMGGRVAPSGLLTLPQGLIRSCNPFFWHIGLDLYNRGLATAVSEMARGFGLGKPTGIVGVDEAAGNIPDPESAVDAVNMAIGQGAILVTPLQAATFIAAVGNGGTLYQPQLIERIAAPDGRPSQVFQPKVMGRLPVSAENLRLIQEALVGVVRSEKPRGTAWHVFTGLDIPIAGKTGTAQSGGDRPHAWFVGYTFAERPDRPDIAVAVLVEHVGEGSDYAAPIFRRVVELYFSGQPLKLYWWESSLNVLGTLTPTPLGPTPVVTPSP